MAQHSGTPRGWGEHGLPGPPQCRHRPLLQAFSNFYYTFHFLNLTSGQPLATANATVWEFCQKPWKLVGGSQGHFPPPWAAASLSKDLGDPTLASVDSEAWGSYPTPDRSPKVRTLRGPASGGPGG